MSLTITAHHEAAHAVVLYRLTGFAESISVVPSAMQHGVLRQQIGRLGHTADDWSDSGNEAHMEARVLSCYAGGHAQRRCDPSTGEEGCDKDNKIAADLLTEWKWEHREHQFRTRAADLVHQHWREIEAVAQELERTPNLDSEEVALIADAAAGLAEFNFGSLEADLAHYRVNRSCT